MGQDPLPGGCGGSLCQEIQVQVKEGGLKEGESGKEEVVMVFREVIMFGLGANVQTAI